jgi:hypothetical protein
MSRIIFLLPLLVLGLIGCASAPKRTLNFTEGNWRAKALIKDKEQGRSYIVNLNFNVIKNQKARMDVTSALGTGIASLVVENQEVRYLLVDSKRYYYGSPRPDVMRPILSVPFDPRWIHNLLFETPIPDKSWSCTKESDGWLRECRDMVSGAVVSWANRQGDKKTVRIDHTKAFVQMNVQAFKPKVEDRKNLFELEVPNGFQKLRIR